jgi:hypothetical protein
MIPVAEIRKPILKERLIPTVYVGLEHANVREKRRAAKAALKVKQGEIRPIRRLEKPSEPGQTRHNHHLTECLMGG